VTFLLRTNDMKNYRILTAYPRGAGVTYSIAKAVSEKVDAVMVCASSDEARHVARQYGIKTASISDPDRYRGMGGIKLWDTAAVDRLIHMYEQKIFDLQHEIQELKSGR